MHRIEQIQKLYGATCVNRRSGNPGVKLTPSYYSIYSDNRIEINEDIVRSVTGNPEYIFCFVHASEPWYANNELFCVIDKESNILDGIKLEKWKLKNIIANSASKIIEVTLVLLDNPHEDIVLKFNDISHDAKLNFPQLWLLFKEINENCKNSHELEIYKKYFVAKTELKATKLSLSEFQHKNYLNYNLINEYKDLLNKIEKMVDGDIKISKT